MDEGDQVAVSYWLPDRTDFEIAYVPAVPAIGTGVYHERSMYRVRDVWIIDDSGTPLAYGVNVFLEPAPDTFLADFDDYFI